MVRRKRRRGIVLLVVLALLALFALTAATFLLVSAQYQRAALSNARYQRLDSSAKPMLEGALYQMLRDTTDTRSVLRGHSLLLDMYGLGGFQGRLQAVTATATGGQLLQLTVLESNVTPVAGTGTFSLSRVNGSYNGRVMTFITGSAKGSSVRIVAYQYLASPGRGIFHVMLPATELAAAISPSARDAFLVNGQPFSGTGVGLNATSTAEMLNVADPGTDGVAGNADDLMLAALLPNMTGLASTNFRTSMVSLSNESYDSPDFQNMALGALMGDATDPVVFPSYHRPDLIHFWFKWIRDNLLSAVPPEQHLEAFLRPYGADNNPLTAGPGEPLPPDTSTNPPTPNPVAQRIVEIKRRIILRPLVENHPNFTGGNDGLTPANLVAAANTYGALVTGGTPPDTASLVNPYLFNFSSQPIAYDVDNDGDGVRDSIWLDIGLPVRTSREGRMVKPLVSILALDLDGRLNLNAHGTPAHHPGTLYAAPNAATYLAGNATSTNLPKGQGYGPPEINLSGLFTDQTQYEKLMRGDATLQVLGRYGWNQLPGVRGLDRLAEIRFFEFPQNYFSFTSAANLRSYQTPPDLRGELALGIDHRGQPSYEVSRIFTRAESPYELDLSPTAPRGLAVSSTNDAPFSPAELERLLRTNDPDARLLPDRLSRFFPEWFNSTATHRRAVTTESADLPIPTTGRPVTPHAMEVFRARILQASTLTDPLNALQEQAVNRALQTLVAHDLFMGLRMDLNRPFGNGQDDSNPANGVVDEHGVNYATALEARLTEPLWTGTPNPTTADPDNDSEANDQNAYLARYHYARHLYCLLMALKDPAHQIDYDGDPSNNNNEETAFAIAQWAINVVDFRDADSIMTPFEFDINPFSIGPGTDSQWNTADDDTGWNVNGQLDVAESSTDRRVVWGCERPELLITETLAFHDRRTEDLANPGGRTTDPAPNDDDDFDQRFKPWGSLYVELYNPWASGQERQPGETTVNGGVALNREFQAGSPVWRLAVSEVSPNDPDSTGAPVPQRLIYFTSTAGPGLPGATVYNTAVPLSAVRPGRYAVVGTARQIEPNLIDPETNLNAGMGFINYIGRRADGDLTMNRRLVMRPDPAPPTSTLDPDLNWFYVLNNGTAVLPQRLYPSRSTGIANILPPVVAPIPGLELSEGDYPAVDSSGVPYDQNTGYATPWDVPLDEDPAIQLDPGMSQDGTISGFRQVHLQRLANPLLPYDAQLNPYRTVDSAPVDLTVFNGLAADSGPSVTPGGYQFGSRERGTTTPPTSVRSLWKQTNTPPAASTAGAVLDHHFSHQLTHSLGYLNSVFDPRYVKDCTGAGGGGTQAPADQYVGAPDYSTTVTSTFPWLTWNNRPYVSQYELTLVPRSPSSRLLKDFTILVGPTPYNPDPANPPPYGHLLNFFATQSQAAPNGPNLYEVFEYTGVPSRFIGTDTWLNPASFQLSGAGTEFFHPPFNRVSHYRDPGRVNINTVFHPTVWEALLGRDTFRNIPALGPSFGDWVNSRRGYPISGSNLSDLLSADIPTIFANPLRGSRSGDLVPLPNMRRAHVDCSLLRARLDNTPTNVNDDIPLFTTSSTALHNETSRHPYFQYQSAQRLANLVTTRSNIYAIWITAGFFEVDPNTQQIGQEAGLETGEVQRHRAFYMIDRSIPVAFQPGENHNVDRAVILRRFIE